MTEANARIWRSSSAQEKRDMRNLIKTRIPPEEVKQPSPDAPEALSPTTRVLRSKENKETPLKALQEMMDILTQKCTDDGDDELAEGILACLQQSAIQFQKLIPSLREPRSGGELCNSAEKRTTGRGTCTTQRPLQQPRSPKCQRTELKTQSASSFVSPAKSSARTPVSTTPKTGYGSPVKSVKKSILGDSSPVHARSPTDVVSSLKRQMGTGVASSSSNFNSSTGSAGSASSSYASVVAKSPTKSHVAEECPTTPVRVSPRSQESSPPVKTTPRSACGTPSSEAVGRTTPRNKSSTSVRLSFKDDKEPKACPKADVPPKEGEEANVEAGAHADNTDEDKYTHKGLGEKKLSGGMIRGWSPSQNGVISRERMTELELSEKIDQKLSQAKENRARLEQEKRGKLQQYHSKLQDSNARRERMTAEAKMAQEEKIQKAETIQKEKLQQVVQKASDEVAKVEEVVWMQNLNKENARLELKTKEEAAEARREELLANEKKKMAQREEQEAKVHDRRRALEAERLEKLQIQEQQKEQQALKFERQKKTRAAARELKMEEHAAKVEQQKAAMQAEQEEKEKQRLKKMDAIAANREAEIERIRGKASAEIEKVKEVVMRKEDGTEKQLASFRDLLQERTKASKKRSLRIQETMERLGKEYQTNARKEYKEKRCNMLKHIKQLNICLHSKRLASCKAHLSEMATVLKKEKREADFEALRLADGYDVLVQLCACQAPNQHVLKAASHTILCAIDSGTEEEVGYLLRAGYVVSLVNVLTEALASGQGAHLSECAPLTHLFSILERCITYHPRNEAGKEVQGLVLNYLDASGLSASLQALLTVVHHPLDNTACEIIYNSLSLLNAAINATAQQKEQSGRRKELYRVVVESTFNLLTTILLPNAPRSGSPTAAKSPSKAGSQAPRIEDEHGKMGNALVNISLLSIRILNTVARVYTEGWQKMICKNFRVELYHVLSFLLTYILDNVGDMKAIDLCHPEDTPDCEAPSKGLTIDCCPKAEEIHDTNNLRPLLHEILLVMGYAGIKNAMNQEIFRWGKSPNLLQQLCSLPVTYFSTLKHVLFPTLVVVCFRQIDSKNILQNDISATSILKYVAELSKEKGIDLNATPTKICRKGKEEEEDLADLRLNDLSFVSADWDGMDSNTASAANSPGYNAGNASLVEGPSTPKKAEDACPEVVGEVAISSSNTLRPGLSPAAFKTPEKKPKKIKRSLSPAQSERSEDDDGLISNSKACGMVCLSTYYKFENRFPMELWPEAHRFFSA